MWAGSGRSQVKVLIQSRQSVDQRGAVRKAVCVGDVRRRKERSKENVSASLLVALENTQSALLTNLTTDDPPTVVQQGDVTLMVHRVPAAQVQAQGSIPGCLCPWFNLQALPTELFVNQTSVDVKMLSLQKNPFAWNPRGNVSAPIVALDLNGDDGTRIPGAEEGDPGTTNIFLPNPVGNQINTTVLDLSNYSTTAIQLPPAHNVLVLKMFPSEDPLPFKVYLGEDHPTETKHIAMTTLPQDGDTLDERYTWLLPPSALGGVSGPLSLLVRPWWVPE
ncbi:hypothetical protein WMY93_033484 [Mugilogobius chulae]|uniref:Uncharacterized protein n=1 Tax=Mugilogobius chulae TaxID=88201 RepID=A0AAW0MI11_9GOBI